MQATTVRTDVILNMDGTSNHKCPSHLTWQNCTPSTPSEMGRFSRWYCLSGSMRGTCCPRSDLWETTDNIITTDGRRGKEGEEERKESEEGKSYMGRRWGRTGTSVRAACERAEMQKAGGGRAAPPLRSSSGGRRLEAAPALSKRWRRRIYMQVSPWGWSTFQVSQKTDRGQNVGVFGTLLLFNVYPSPLSPRRRS